VGPERAAQRVFALAAGVLLAVGCHRAGGATNAGAAGSVPASKTDSIEGVVRVVGTDAFPQVVLITGDASPAVTLDGPGALRHLAGLRIAAVGERSNARLLVQRFTVLSANGVPATDGTVAADGNALMLVTADGMRHRLLFPPPLLRANVGHRAWISGPLDREPVAFGIIE
jgi:hypothetical protein